MSNSKEIKLKWKDQGSKDRLKSYAKTGTEVALGYGIGRGLKLDTKADTGSVIFAALGSAIGGSLADKFILNPAIKPEHPDDSFVNPADIALILANGYHGYARNNNQGAYAAAWILGSIFVSAELMGVALAQGYAKPLK